MRKKIYVKVLGFVCLGLILCTSQLWAQEKIVLRTIGGPDPHGYEAAENELFTRLYPWTKIQRDTVPYGRGQRLKLLASFAAGGEAAYDMYVIDCVEVPEYAAAGWALDVTSWLSEEMEEGILPFAKAGMMYKNRWYGLPFISEWKSFVYNDHMLKEAGIAGPPKTWDEFVDQSLKLQGAGIVRKYATSWSWAQKECIICDFAALMASFGGKFFDENNNPLFNTSSGVEAVQWMIDSMDKYKISDSASLTYTESDVDDAMEAGDIAFCLRWGLPLVVLNDPKASKVVGECKIGLFPARTLNTYPGYTVSGPMGWSVSVASIHKVQAWEYVKFRAGLIGAKRNAILYGVVPGWASAYKDPYVTKGIPGLDVMLESAKHVVNRPRVPWYYKFSDALQVELHRALVKEKSPKKALDDAVAKCLEIKTGK